MEAHLEISMQQGLSESVHRCHGLPTVSVLLYSAWRSSTHFANVSKDVQNLDLLQPIPQSLVEQVDNAPTCRFSIKRMALDFQEYNLLSLIADDGSQWDTHLSRTPSR